MQIPYKDECQIIPKQVPNQKCIQVPKQQCSTVPVKVPRTVYKSSHQPLCGRGKYGWLMNNENQLLKNYVYQNELIEKEIGVSKIHPYSDFKNQKIHLGKKINKFQSPKYENGF